MIIEKTMAENSRYDLNLRDFTAEGELTVTITLNEYRDLIRESVENKCRKDHENWLKEYNRAQEAEKRAEKLENELNELYRRMAINVDQSAVVDPNAE